MSMNIFYYICFIQLYEANIKRIYVIYNVFTQLFYVHTLFLFIINNILYG